MEYRSINFVHETLETDQYQPYAVVNYPNEEKFTRIVEYKHFTQRTDGSQKTALNTRTTIVKEYTTADGEPYYPVPNPDNEHIYQQYKKEADNLDNIYFVGRLANYKYFNMDQAFRNALDLFASLEPSAEPV